MSIKVLLQKLRSVDAEYINRWVYFMCAMVVRDACACEGKPIPATARFVRGGASKDAKDHEMR